MRRLIFLTLSLAAVAALVWLLVWGFGRARSEAGEESEIVKTPARVSVDASGQNVITLDARARASADIETEALRPVTVQPEAVAYGALLEDPALSYVIRAPVSGTLGAGAWPAAGQTVESGGAVGRIEARLALADRVSLMERLASARAEVESATASMAASRAAYERARKLNADDKNISDRTVEEAESRLRGDESRLKAAGQTVQLIRQALDAAGPEGILTLSAGKGGQVVEVLAQPGESVEAGQALLRLARFEQLLARVELPAGETLSAPPSEAEIVVLGHEDQPVRGKGGGWAPAVDPKTQSQSLIFRVQGGALNLRPGMAVTAHIERPGPTQTGAVVPGRAVVRFGGGAWVYVKTSPTTFQRRRLSLDRRGEGGWTTLALQGGEEIVVVGAQTLLSEELKSQIQVGEASEGR